MKQIFSLILLAGALAAQTPPPAVPAAAAPAAAAREPGLYATLKTSQGDITVKLFETETPVTVQNFVDLARGTRTWKDPKTRQMVRQPLYPGTVFHRVVAGFMIQGGDPTGTGMGEIGYTIPDEFVPTLKFDQPGRLGMANAGPHTGSSEFFITEVATPHLDGHHTVFGQVVEGQEVVNKIAHLPAVKERPNPAVRLNIVVFNRVGPVPPGGVVMRPAVQGKSTKAVRPATPAGKK
jgi:cyclophilin family peptidyl-prolyl cis-trans isomerase